MRPFITLCMVWCSFAMAAQGVSDLDALLEIIVREGFGVDVAKTQHTQADSEFRIFRSQLRPQVTLAANLPTYSRTSTSVVQPNGSIAFQPLNQNLASVTLSAVQPILFTGGSLFVEAGLDRFDDFGRRFTQYNGVPLRVGYTQSLVGFNGLKWDRRIAIQRRHWADQQRDAAIDAALVDAANLYFNALIARTNRSLAENNLGINEKLLRLAEERLELGKISLEEKLQMEAEFKLAAMLQAQAANEVQQTELTINTLLRSNIALGADLQAPQAFEAVLPPLGELIQRAIENAPNVQAAQLELENWRREAARRKAEAGINLQIFAATGLVQSGNQVSDVYEAPFSEQQIQAGVSIPLIDWGRRAAVKSAVRAQIESAETTLEQQRKLAENSVKQACLDIQEISARLVLQQDLLTLAEARSAISTERYTMGKLALTEWVLAQRNRDQVQRDYLLSLRDFYLAYFELRRITGYDLRTQTIRIYNAKKQ